MWKLWKACLLWRTSYFQLIDRYKVVQTIHTKHPLYTGLKCVPVGDVGNWGLHACIAPWFSNPPELHSLDLENPAPAQPRPLQPLQPDSHFSSSNYGYYCLFFHSFVQFPLPRRNPAHMPLLHLPIAPCAVSKQSAKLQAVKSAESREASLFSTPTGTRRCIQSKSRKDSHFRLALQVL